MKIIRMYDDENVPAPLPSDVPDWAALAEPSAERDAEFRRKMKERLRTGLEALEEEEPEE